MLYFFEVLKEKNVPIYYFGWLNLVAAIGCLLLAQFTDTQVAGANAWYKPFKFALSTVIFSWSMGWYLQYIEDIQTATLYSWVVMGLLTFENIYIGLQDFFCCWVIKLNIFVVGSKIQSVFKTVSHLWRNNCTVNNTNWLHASYLRSFNYFIHVVIKMQHARTKKQAIGRLQDRHDKI